MILHRMLFNTVKMQYPELKIHFACLPEYAAVVKDHPDLESVIDQNQIDDEQFAAVFNTSIGLSNKYENKYGIDCKYNRADIWSKFCGFDLLNHDMQFRLDSALLQRCRTELESLRRFQEAPIVLFCPVSKVPTKSLLDNQIDWIVNSCKGVNLLGIHTTPIRQLQRHGLAGIYGKKLYEWIHYTAAADMVVSVDSALFHLAGGLKKPLLGIFTFANGKTYGQHYNFVLLQKHRDDGNWTCGPCYNYKACPKTKKEMKPCLTELAQSDFENAVRQLLGNTFNLPVL